MAALFLELFSEEIPARMQTRAADDLSRLAVEALAALSPSKARTFHGPRRIALSLEVASGVAESRTTERGPRASAPEQALAGFLRKHGAARDELRVEGEFFVLDRVVPGADAATLIAAAMPPLLWRFPWPKSMRWGGTSAFTWVRPLRRIVCLLDGAVVPFALARGEDDAHGLVSGDLTEGHRFMAPGAVAVRSAEDWEATLRERFVIADAAGRKALIGTGIARLAAAEGLTVVDDPGLLDEVSGLVEWPVALLGRIDPAFMDLPPEVMQVSMRVNQRYFALRHADDTPAARFAFAANIDASDGGAAIIAGNERVLRARFSDARHFWDLDRRTKLADRVDALKAITFHAKLGTQFERAIRLERLAGKLAPMVEADPASAEKAGLLAKADLTTGMVGEFPELQGVMGGYYADADQETVAVADAVRDHYAPRGASDSVPVDPVTIAVALADRLDTLTGFFWIGERPTGSGDPYALRRAALSVIRLIRDNGIRVSLRTLIDRALVNYVGEHGLLRRIKLDHTVNFLRNGVTVTIRAGEEFIVDAPDILTLLKFENPALIPNNTDILFNFVAERLRIQLRAEGARHDVLAALLATRDSGDDIVRLLARVDALAEMLGTPDGRDLLAAYKRAANILRIEDKRDGPHDGAPDPALFMQDEERALAQALESASGRITAELVAERDAEAMATMASLRAPLDAFFEAVTVNDPKPEIRLNRLRLLARLRATLDQAADFSMIDG